MERLAAVMSVVTAIGIAAAAVLGPLGIGIIRFHMNRNAIVQYKGSEVVMLAAVAGLLMGGWLWLTNAGLAAALSTGLALFVIYTFVTVVMPQEYALYPDGNVERLMLLYFAITALASVLLVLGVNTLVPLSAHVSDGWRTATQWILSIEAILFALMWLSRIAKVYRNGLTDADKEIRGLFWLVKYLDLGFAIPLALLAVVLVRYQQPMATTLVLAIAGFLTCMLVPLAGMAVSLWIHDEAGGSLLLAGIMTGLAVASGLVWFTWARALSAT